MPHWELRVTEIDESSLGQFRVLCRLHSVQLKFWGPRVSADDIVA